MGGGLRCLILVDFEIIDNKLYVRYYLLQTLEYKQYTIRLRLLIINHILVNI